MTFLHDLNLLEALTSDLVGGCVGIDYNQVGTQNIPNIAVEVLATRPASYAVPVAE